MERPCKDRYFSRQRTHKMQAAGCKPQALDLAPYEVAILTAILQAHAVLAARSEGGLLPRTAGEPGSPSVFQWSSRDSAALADSGVGDWLKARKRQRRCAMQGNRPAVPASGSPRMLSPVHGHRAVSSWGFCAAAGRRLARPGAGAAHARPLRPGLRHRPCSTIQTFTRLHFTLESL